MLRIRIQWSFGSESGFRFLAGSGSVFNKYGSETLVSNLDFDLEPGSSEILPKKQPSGHFEVVMLTISLDSKRNPDQKHLRTGNTWSRQTIVNYSLQPCFLSWSAQHAAASHLYWKHWVKNQPDSRRRRWPLPLHTTHTSNIYIHRKIEIPRVFYTVMAACPLKIWFFLLFFLVFSHPFLPRSRGKTSFKMQS